MRDSAPPLQYGDELSVDARIRPLDFPRNPGLADYNRVLEERGVVGSAIAGAADIEVMSRNHGLPWMRWLVMPVRRHVVQVVDQLLPGAEGALLCGLLIGGRQGLPRDVQQAFTDSGIVHILAVSGMNVSIVVGVLWLLLGVLGVRGWWRFWTGALAVICYVAVAGGSAAPTRAGLMALALLLSGPVQRRATPGACLAVAGLVLLAAEPATLFDVGAQLSFAATLGIILIAGRLDEQTWQPSARQWMRWLAAPVAVSLAATLATAPLMLHHFFRVQPLAFLTSYFVAPLVGAAMPLGIAMVAVNLVSTSLAGIIANALWAVLWLILKLALVAGSLRGAMFEPGRLSWVGVALAFGVMAAALYLPRRRAWLALVILVFAGLNLLAWSSVLRGPETRVTFLDPRKGDAMLFEDTLGHRVLFDAGIDGAGVVRDFLRSRGIHSLDAVVITHPDRDHYGGLVDLGERFRIGQVLVSPFASSEPTYNRLLERLRRRGTRVVTVGQGSRLEGLGFGVEFLWPGADPGRSLESENSSSLVARVEHAGFTMLLTGDMEALELLPAASLRADLLKSPHHGSSKGNRPELYGLVQPEYVVVMGRHPTPAKLEQRLARTAVQHVNTRAEGGLVVRFVRGRPELLRYQ
jgi:competence protein ComEC